MQFYNFIGIIVKYADSQPILSHNFKFTLYESFLPHCIFHCPYFLSQRKKLKTFTNPIQNLNVAKAQLISVKKCIVLVVSNQQNPTKVDRYYVLQGATSKEQAIPQSMLNESNDFVSLQAGSKFWVLTLTESNRYRNFLTDAADTKIFKGFGFTKYQENGLDFDNFISELKSGKHDSKFD